MKLQNLKYVFLVGLGIFIGYMVGSSMDPVDQAVRKAQEINRSNLKGISSLREGGLFQKPVPLQERLKTDVAFSNEYVTKTSNDIVNKEKAIATLTEAKEFIKLATQEVFVDSSLQIYLISLGRIQLENGMIFQAITNLKKSYDIRPDDSSTAELLALSYLALYQLLPEGSEKSSIGEQAVRFLKLTLKTKPNSINSLYGLALIYIDQGLYKDALPLFLQILKLNPEHIEALLGVARIYYDTGNIDQARKVYETTEALILELKNKRYFSRQKVNTGLLDQKLKIIRDNLEIIYGSQSAFGSN